MNKITNRIKIIKKNTDNGENQPPNKAAKVLESESFKTEITATIENWVSDWRERNKLEKSRSLDYLNQLKFKA